MFKVTLVLAVFLGTLALSFLGGMYLFDDVGFLPIALSFVVSAILALLAMLGTIELIILVNESQLENETLTPVPPSSLWHSL